MDNSIFFLQNYYLLAQLPWSHLTDKEKERLLRGNTRLTDSEIFLNEFQSFEAPEKIYQQEDPIK